MSGACTRPASPVRYRRKRQVSSCDFHKVCPSICRRSLEARILGCKWAGCTFFQSGGEGRDHDNGTHDNSEPRKWDSAAQVLWHTSQVEHVVASLRSDSTCTIPDVPFEVQVRIEKWVHEKNGVESRYGSYRWSVVNVEKDIVQEASGGANRTTERISVIIARSARRRDSFDEPQSPQSDRGQTAFASGREADPGLDIQREPQKVENKSAVNCLQSNTQEGHTSPPNGGTSTKHEPNDNVTAGRHDTGTEVRHNVGSTDQRQVQSITNGPPSGSQRTAPPALLEAISSFPPLRDAIEQRLPSALLDSNPGGSRPRTPPGPAHTRGLRRESRRYSYPYPNPSSTPEIQEVVGNSGSVSVQMHPVITSSYPSQTRFLSLRIPCFWSSDIRITLNRAFSTSSPSLLPSVSSSSGSRTRCDTFVLCYVLAAVISLVSSVLYSALVHDTSGGFTVGAYLVALASLMIMPLHSRHLRSCECNADRSSDINTGSCMDERVDGITTHLASGNAIESQNIPTGDDGPGTSGRRR